MKHLKSLLLAATLFAATSFTAQAQTKVAHINTQELVESMPEMQSAKAELEKLAKTYETDIQAMATELQNKIKQYDSESYFWQSQKFLDFGLSKSHIFGDFSSHFGYIPS